MKKLFQLCAVVLLAAAGVYAQSANYPGGNSSSAGIAGNVLAQPYPGLVTFGTSITQPCNGIGTTLSIPCYIELLNYDVNVAPLNDYAVSGSQLADQQLIAYSNVNFPYTRNSSILFEIGVNDANPANGHAYTTANQQANYNNMLGATIAWLTVPSQNKVFGQSCAQTGTWSNDTTTYSPNTTMAVQSTTNGSTLTCNVTTTGPALYLAYRMIDGDGGTASVTVDGASAGTINGFGVGGSLISTQNGATSGIGMLRYPVTAGAHTVVVTVTSATNGSNLVSILWTGSELPTAQLTAPGPAILFLPGVLHQQSGTNDTATALFDGFNKAAVTLYSGDGAQVAFVNWRSYLNTSTDMFDLLHPSVSGNLKMRDAVEFVMQQYGLSIQSGNQTIKSGTQQTFFDNFNRANGALAGTNWINMSLNGATMSIASNQVGGSGATGQGVVYYYYAGNQVFLSPDQFCEVTITAFNGTSDNAGCVVRATGINVSSVAQYFGCFENTTTMTGRQFINGTPGNATTGITGAVGDVVRAEIYFQSAQDSGILKTAPLALFPNTQFEMLLCYQNGVQVLQTPIGGAPAIRSGYPGLYVEGSVMTVDNFEGGNIHAVAQVDSEQNFSGLKHFNKNAYQCTMSTGTSCTVTIPQLTNSAINHCMVTEQGTTPVAGSCSISGTTVTVTAASSNSATWSVWIY